MRLSADSLASKGAHGLCSARAPASALSRPRALGRAAPLAAACRASCSTSTAMQESPRPGALARLVTAHRNSKSRSTLCRVVQVEDSVGGRRRASVPMLSSRDEASPTPEVAAGGKNPSGYLALLGVAILWGSYTPAIRLLYQIDTPPDAPLLNALQATLSALFLVAANVTASLTQTPNNNPRPYTSNPLMAEDIAVRQATIRRDRANRKLSKVVSSEYLQQQQVSALPPDPPRRKPSNAIEHAIASALNWRTTELTLAGAEVGLWMSLAFSLEVAGLQLASATKVAFLNQVSVLITPLLVHLSGERVRGLEWVACGLGLMGSILVALDSLMNGGGGGHGGHGGAVDGAGNEVLGLVFVLISSMFFALSTVRLGRYSSMFDPLQLSTTSTCTLGLLSLTWVAASILGRENGGAYELEVINNMLASNTCILTLIWVGLGPGALAAYLQATGQKSVPPAQAQVIYSTTPLWAAGFAILALNAADEAMGSIAWVGAAVMLGSSLMTALLPPEDPVVAMAAAGAAAGAGNGTSSAAARSMALPLSTFEESDSESEDDDSWHHDDEDRRSGRYLATEMYVKVSHDSRLYEQIDEDVRERQGLRDIF